MPCAVRTGLFAAVALTLWPAPGGATPTRSAYVIGANDASVTRVDLISGVTASNLAALGAIANRISVDSSLTVAAIVCSGSDDVRAFDLASESITAVVDLPAGSNPWDVEIAGDRWFVTATLDDRVLVVDPASASVVDSIAVGRAPQGLCVAGGKLYVANTGFDFSTFGWEPGSVSVIDLATLGVVATIPVALNPQECVAASDGRVHVVCAGNFGAVHGAIDVVDPASDLVVATLPVPGYPGTATVGGPIVWLGLTTTGFSSAIVGYRAADLVWEHDAGDPLLPSFDFYGNLRASETGEILVADFAADLLLVESPGAPGSPAAYLVGDGPIDLAVVERSGPVSLALSGLSAIETAAGVRLRWSSSDPGVREFSVERSAPGAARAPVTRIVAGGASEWTDAGAPFDITLTWHVTAFDARGRIAGTASTTLVRRARPSDRLAIHSLRPNPAPAAVTIAWFAPRAGQARLDILDVAGRRLASLDLGDVPRGEGSVRWDGRDAAGRLVAPGVYFVRLAAGGETAVERGLRLR